MIFKNRYSTIIVICQLFFIFFKACQLPIMLDID